MNKKKIILLVISIFFLAFAFALRLKAGSINISFSEIIAYFTTGELSNVKINIMNLRFHRVILVILVGAGLSISGATYQGALRNMLADPFILGVSSGAALFSAIGMTYEVSPLTMLGLVDEFSVTRDLPIMAFLGSMISISILMLIYRCNPSSLLTIILGGVAINSFLSASLTLIMYYSKNLRNIYSWLLGSFEISSTSVGTIQITGIIIIVCTIYLIWKSSILNIMLLDERVSASLGINVEYFRLKFIIVSSIIVAVVVSVSGMIGFIGLLVPHGARFIIGADNRYLLPFSFILGGAVLAICDALAHTLISGIIIPVGVITSFIGAPFFIYLLVRRSNI